MRPFVLIILLVLLPSSLLAQTDIDSLFAQLDEVIEKKKHFEDVKRRSLDDLTYRFLRVGSSDMKQRFELSKKLHQEYFTFNYDSAVYYSRQLLEIANQIKDSSLINEARLRMSETLLASGLFSEVRDSLSVISSHRLSDSLQVKYYYLFSRLYIDMTNYYQRPFYTEKYRDLGSQYLDSAVAVSVDSSQTYFSLKGLKHSWNDECEKAAKNFSYLFDHYTPEGRQFAVDASTYAYVFSCLGNPEKEMKWLLYAAIQDIKLANKENVALRIVANRLYEQGKIQKASRYLKIAIDDAKSYGAVQREFQISQIQPIVEAAKMDLVEKQNSRIQAYATAVSLLSVTVIIFLILTFRQYRKVKKVKNELDHTNHTLAETNAQLREVNLIKEEYIGFFFRTNSDLVKKLDEYRQAIDNKLALNKPQQLSSVITRADIKREREVLFRDFDAGFLNIFPDFIEKFNALFREEDRELPNNSKHLNAYLRIFALIRLGIMETDKIAHILNYSVNTINTYKTRIKNKSIVSNEDFEKEILKIQSI